jgi:ParB family transcriptional regulator, chromosome partitioning protein
MTALPLDAIKIGPRARQDFGDIAALARSIEAIGLLHPVVVTPLHELVCGERRIEAARLLGWREIPARVVNMEAIVFGEQAENIVRKDFSVSERVAIGAAVEAELGERRGRPKENVQNLAQLPGGEKTRDIAAEKSGFGNAETYRQAKAIVEKGTTELIAAVDRGDVSISAGAEVARLPEPEQREIVAAGPKAVVEAARAFRTFGMAAPNNIGCNEWYTPARHIELVRRVLGEIDLDPASHPFAQQTVQAAQFFTQDDDGLAKPWRGRVFCNPPYSKGLITPFVSKLLAEISSGNVSEAILLTHNHSDTRWFQAALGAAARVCFTAGRLDFYGVNGEIAAPVQGQTFHYFGDNVEKFEEVFSSIGAVIEVKVVFTPEGEAPPVQAEAGE